MGTEYKMSPDYSAAKKEKLDYTSEASRTGFMMRKYFEESTPINDVQLSLIHISIRTLLFLLHLTDE